MSIALTAPPARQALSPARLKLLLALGLLVGWEVLPRFGVIPQLFLPSLSETLAALFGSASDYAAQMLLSLRAIVIALVFACGLGIGLGLLIGSVAPLRRTIQPLASGLYAVPLVIIYPLLTAWFGIGPQSKIIFASIYGLLPCLLGTMAGIQTVDRQLLVVARSLRASRWQMITRVLLPACVPTVLASFRVGGALVIVGVVVAEMLTSSAGIGYLISRYRTMLDSPHVFAGILLVVALVLAFGGLVRLIEHHTRHWRFSTRSGETN